MKVTSTLNIGGASFTFEVEEQDEMAAMVNSITLASPRRTCNVCGSDGLDDKHLLAYRTKEGYRYVKVQCECGARSTLGQYRDGDGFFWKEYEEYKPDGEQAAPQQPTQAGDDDESEPETPKDLISFQALAQIEGLLAELNWSTPQTTNYLAKHYSVSRLDKLSMDAGRRLYRDLKEKVAEAQKKQTADVPF